MSPKRSALRSAALPPRPALGPAPKIAVPTVAERTLGSGLRVAAVRRRGVPLVEIRLRVPFAGTAKSHLARSAVLGESFFTGTASHDAQQLAEAIQGLGGSLGASTDADRLAVGGSALAENLRPLLELLASTVTGNTYPADEVAGERDRVAEEVAIARTTPSALADEAVSHRLFGRHPYGRDLPTVTEVAAVTAGSLRTLHAQQVSPVGALLVIVGDVAPTRALDLAAQTFADWTAHARTPVTLPPVPAFVPGGIALVDRPGSVQTSLRVVAPAPPRDDPSYAALSLVNTVFAGYFSSRLVANIREDKGYTYSPHAGIMHADLASYLAVTADVATEVTAPALVETRYEMAKIAAAPVTQDELDAAGRYLVGTLALSTASQAGLASTLARLLDAGFDATWLRSHPAALGRVTVDSAHEAAQRWLAPAAAGTVLVGDAERIRRSVSALDTVDVVQVN
ncbi:MAG TPA: pitrilysin family protein [Mycobacteriales bacterium]|nr:pitrilysin family protein [Mycobacteriales bacterium]